eukprot:2467524-Rhodomonas_salina.4
MPRHSLPPAFHSLSPRASYPPDPTTHTVCAPSLVSRVTNTVLTGRLSRFSYGKSSLSYLLSYLFHLVLKSLSSPTPGLDCRTCGRDLRAGVPLHAPRLCRRDVQSCWPPLPPRDQRGPGLAFAFALLLSSCFQHLVV